LILVPLLGWFLLPGPPLTLDVPVLGRFNYEGGIRLTTQFSALLVGLVIYTASFIAEVVRAGIQSVSRGQIEAARAIGLSNLQALRLVILPQALRVIIPPLISQYLNLTKNSSLAIAIGYPDLFSVGRIMINQAGRAVPVFLMIMLAYLAMSLTYSIVLNLYNRRIRFVER
jgi:general L-amino acid transport system permease protein